MTIKTTLIEMFDKDIEKATGQDKQDLETVRNLIIRTEYSDDHSFMESIRKIWTLMEKDAYFRAKEWKRRNK